MGDHGNRKISIKGTQENVEDLETNTEQIGNEGPDNEWEQPIVN